MRNVCVDIYVPTFGRGHKLNTYYDHIKSVTPDCRVVYIVEADDKPSKQAKCDVLVTNKRSKTYAGAINSAWDELHSPIFFCGADDLVFYPNWLEIALSHMVDPIMVVGTNDLHNQEVARGEHATHYLINGKYIEKGQSVNGEPVLPECYSHNYTDREFIGIAKNNGVFLPCTESVVEHLHYTFSLSKFDSTYAKTRIRVSEDGQIYESRRHLWNRL